MALSAKLQQVNNWSVWCDITDHSHQTQLKQCIVTAHWPTNGLQRLILRIPSQQLIMFCHQARTHARMHTHTYSDIYIHYYTVGLNIMYRPTFFLKHSIGANQVGTQFLFWGPRFFKPVESQDPVFYALARTLLFIYIILCQFA